MHERLTADNRQRVARGERPVRVRIGIHTGPLVVGNIGAPERLDYTVLGDTVNVAQRLEELGKEVDARAECVVLVTDATAGQLGPEFETAPAGEFQLTGRRGEVRVARLQL